MDRKICFITGGNSGIGKAAAIRIASTGHKVIIGCRNEARGKSALDEIKKTSLNTDIHLLLIDMSSGKLIKKAADEFKIKNQRLDVLIHNAADFDVSRKSPVYSEEGIENIWMTNHIGPVLLTEYMTGMLKASKQGRIITVASKGLIMHPFLKVSFDDPEFRNGNFSVERAYYQSKLSQIMYTYWLAGEFSGTDMTANCIRVTNVRIDTNRYPDISKFQKKLYSIKSKLSITPEDMAATYEYLATSNEVRNTTGKLFDERNRIVKSNSYSTDQKNISKLMKVTEQYVERIKKIQNGKGVK